MVATDEENPAATYTLRREAALATTSVRRRTARRSVDSGPCFRLPAGSCSRRDGRALWASGDCWTPRWAASRLSAALCLVELTQYSFGRFGCCRTHRKLTGFRSDTEAAGTSEGDDEGYPAQSKGSEVLEKGKVIPRGFRQCRQRSRVRAAAVRLFVGTALGAKCLCLFLGSSPAFGLERAASLDEHFVFPRDNVVDRRRWSHGRNVGRVVVFADLQIS
jgi:hypothetical protein